jgi:hypothetical protein
MKEHELENSFLAKAKYPYFDISSGAALFVVDKEYTVISKQKDFWTKKKEYIILDQNNKIKTFNSFESLSFYFEINKIVIDPKTLIISCLNKLIFKKDLIELKRLMAKYPEYSRNDAFA